MKCWFCTCCFQHDRTQTLSVLCMFCNGDVNEKSSLFVRLFDHTAKGTCHWRFQSQTDNFTCFRTGELDMNDFTMLLEFLCDALERFGFFPFTSHSDIAMMARDAFSVEPDM